jgi:lysozyme
MRSPRDSLRTGPRARGLIKKWEGIEDGDPSTVNLDPYICPAGYWTIGWGHVVRDERGRMLKGRRDRDAAKAVYPNGITKEEADLLLRADLVEFEQYVRRICTPTTHPGQFGAMVSLCFNVGPTNFLGSSVARHHQAGNHQQAGASFLLWNKARIRGRLVVLRGLTRRREEERALYLEYS